MVDPTTSLYQPSHATPVPRAERLAAHDAIRDHRPSFCLKGQLGASGRHTDEELGMRPLVAHCHLGLGILYAKIGQREQARAELSTAIAMYHAMDMTFWLPQAEVVLAQVEER